MKKTFSRASVLLATGILMLASFHLALGNDIGFDSEILNKIIPRLLRAEEIQQDLVSNVTFSGYIIERRLKGNGEIKEEKRLERISYLRRRADATRATSFKMDMHDRFLSYEKNGELREEKKLKEEIREKLSKRKNRSGSDISDPLVDVFLPRHRYAYTYTYLGLDDTLVKNYTCYVIQVRAKPEALKAEKDKARIEGEFYIDTLSCRLARADFRPARLKGNMFLKLKELELSLTFQKFSDSIWFPEYIYVKGKAKAGFFFSINFESEGFYIDPEINSNLPDSLFGELMSVGH